jgi:hypothetical protein
MAARMMERRDEIADTKTPAMKLLDELVQSFSIVLKPVMWNG